MLCYIGADKERKGSAVLPIGLALFDEGAQTFLRIFEAIEFVEENVHRMFKAVAQREAHAAENGFLRHGEHGTGVAVDAIHEVVDGFFQLRFGDEAIDHAQIESALSGNGFASEHKFEGDFWTNEKRKNGGRKRRKNTNADFRLGEARLGRGDDEIAEGRELRAAADGRPIDDTDDRLAKLEHAGKSGMKRVEHLENALGSVFADVNAAAEDFACGIEDDQFDFVALAGIADAVRHFAKHGFVEKIVLGAVHGHAGDTAVATELDEFEFVGRALYGR